MKFLFKQVVLGFLYIFAGGLYSTCFYAMASAGQKLIEAQNNTKRFVRL